MKKYIQIADRIRGLIENGALAPGERVPSVRRLSRQEGVSPMTVLNAYLQLENRGYIVAKPQSGFYVHLRREPLPPEPDMRVPSLSATAVDVGDLVSQVYAVTRDKSIVSFASACPSPAFFPSAQLARIMARIARREPALCNTYDLPPGSLVLRRRIAQRSLTLGCRLSPDEIVTTCGAMEALNLNLRAVAKAGDNIGIESPTYFGILQAIESLGMRAVEIATDPKEGIDIDAAKKAIKNKRIKTLIVMPSFHNPLGCRMRDENKKALVELVTGHDIPLIEDDVYGDLPFQGERPRAAKAFDKAGNVLLCASFSKSLAPGYRVGWAAPGRYIKKVEQLKFMNTVATPLLPQLAIAEFLENGGYDRHLRRLRLTLETQVQRFSQTIARHFPTDTRISRPTGSFVLWVELPKGADTLQLQQRALAQRIAIAPGPLFSAKGGYRNCMRISCGVPWSPEVERALQRLGALAHGY